MSEIVDRIVAAFNARDIEAFTAGYAEDVAVEDAAGTELVRGLAALRERYAAVFAACPDLHCEVSTRVVVGEYVVDEERVSGRLAEPERLVVVYRVAAGRVDRERIIR